MLYSRSKYMILPVIQSYCQTDCQSFTKFKLNKVDFVTDYICFEKDKLYLDKHVKQYTSTGMHYFSRK